MNDQFRLYPRGFLGSAAIVVVPRHDDSGVGIVTADRNSDSQPRRFKMLGAPNQVIDALYRSMLEVPSDMERFEWREKLLKAALTAFGTTSVMTWVRAQVASPYCGKYHKAFIRDCLVFASGGKRTFAISTWNNLLGDDDSSTDGKLPDQDDCLYFRSRPLAEAQFTDLIHAWCSQPGGYSDMAMSLNILFGRYAGLH